VLCVMQVLEGSEGLVGMAKSLARMSGWRRKAETEEDVRSLHTTTLWGFATEGGCTHPDTIQNEADVHTCTN
jgi:hypothetical protein